MVFLIFNWLTCLILIKNICNLAMAQTEKLQCFIYLTNDPSRCEERFGSDRTCLGYKIESRIDEHECNLRLIKVSAN